MKRSYEITYIMPANIGEQDQQALEEKVLEWIGTADGEVKNSSHWGRRRLAYPIGQNREGYYIFLEAEMDPGQLPEFDRRMTIEPGVIRHLVVRQGE